MPGMKPRIPTSRKTRPTRAAIDWTGVRSLNVTSKTDFVQIVSRYSHGETPGIRRRRRTGSGRQDDDAVRIGNEPCTGVERDPTEGHGDSDLTVSTLSARTRVRPERLDAEAELVQRDGVTNAAVDDDSRPAAVARERRDRITEQG